MDSIRILVTVGQHDWIWVHLPYAMRLHSRRGRSESVLSGSPLRHHGAGPQELHSDGCCECSVRWRWECGCCDDHDVGPSGCVRRGCYSHPDTDQWRPISSVLHPLSITLDRK
eukprot:PhF_6_TR38612/c2_g1_i1/m.57497